MWLGRGRFVCSPSVFLVRRKSSGCRNSWCRSIQSELGDRSHQDGDDDQEHERGKGAQDQGKRQPHRELASENVALLTSRETGFIVDVDDERFGRNAESDGGGHEIDQ